jgi:hypothetical protein
MNLIVGSLVIIVKNIQQLIVVIENNNDKL